MTLQAGNSITLLLSISRMENGGFLVTEIDPCWQPTYFGVGPTLAEALANYAEGVE